MSKVIGGDKIRQNFRKRVAQIRGPMTERAVTQVLIVAAGYASAMTPDATSTLINSQYRDVRMTVGGDYIGELGYGAKYAQYVHDAPGTLLGANVSRHPSRLGKVWGPDAEPEFLTKAFERDGRAAIEAIIAGSYRL